MSSSAIKGLPTENNQELKTGSTTISEDENVAGASEHFDEISGYIKWFDDIKGYGLSKPMTRENRRKGDILVHFSILKRT